MIKKFLIIFPLWLLSILFTAIWTFENPEKIEKIKSHIKKKQTVQVEAVEDDGQKFIANSFTVEVKKVFLIKSPLIVSGFSFLTLSIKKL